MTKTNTITMQHYYDKYFKTVEEYVKSKLECEFDVYDLTADIMLNSWIKLQELGEVQSVKTYVRREAYRAVKRYDIAHGGRIVIDMTNLSYELEDSIIEACFNKQFADKLLSFLDKDHAYILRRLYLEDARISEIADEMGWYRHRVSTHAIKAINELHRFIHENIRSLRPMIDEYLQ